MPEYIVKVQRTVEDQFRVKGTSKSAAVWAVAAALHAEELPEGMTRIVTARQVGTPKVWAGTVDNQHVDPTLLDIDEEDPMGTAEVADGLVQQLREAEAANSGETEVGSPAQKRAAR